MRPDQETALQRLYSFAVDEARRSGERQRIEWARNMLCNDGTRYTGPVLVNLETRAFWEIVGKAFGRTLDELAATPSTELGPPWRA